MRMLNIKNIFVNYCLPIILLPFIAIILEIFLKIFFNLGSYLGVFMRGLYELVLKNI